MALKAKDLRIGNIIQVGGNTLETYQTYKPMVVRLDVIEAIAEENKERPDAILSVFQPIRLTDEWLEKLGLIKKNITEDMPEGLKQPDIDEDGSIWYNWVHGLFNLEIQSNGEIWFEVYSHYKHVKYVHELQNLYYSLCGEELVLK